MGFTVFSLMTSSVLTPSNRIRKTPREKKSTYLYSSNEQIISVNELMATFLFFAVILFPLSFLCEQRAAVVKLRPSGINKVLWISNNIKM